MKSVWSRWARLTGLERSLLLRAWGLLWMTRLGLRLLPYRQWHEIVERWSRNPRVAPGSCPLAPERVARLVDVASHCVKGGHNCLTRALVTHWALRRYGHPSVLHIGVCHGDAGPLQAHAWIESHGKIVMGGLHDLANFKAFPVIRSGQS